MSRRSREEKEFERREEEARERLRQAKERQQRQADETGIWSFLATDAPEIPWHKCLMCGVAVFDREVHLNWHASMGQGKPTHGGGGA